MFRAKEFVKAASLEEAYTLNQKRSNIVLGGFVWLKMGDRNKQAAIDLSGLGLDTIEEKEEEFSIGAMCTLRMLETHTGLNQAFGDIFKECTRHIVGVQFRNCATVGGSIFGRFGFSDILTCMMALDTYVELYKGGFIPLKDFVNMPKDSDILVRVVIKKDGRRAAYLSERQTKTDFPVIACCVAKDHDRWYVAVGARPYRAVQVTFPADETKSSKDLAEKASSEFTYGSNLRGSAEYREHLAKVCIRRCACKITGGEA